MATSSRRHSRELALQVLFQLEFAPQHDLVTALDNFRAAFTAEEGVWQYALTLLQGVQKSRQDIDSIIQENMAHWKIERLSLVDLNILRIATFELKYGGNEVPPNAAINEAIEMAKKYSTSDSGKFVNGVLDQIRKQSAQ